MVDENSTFGGFLTDIGEARQANANALGLPWKLTHMLLGDANGTDPVPDPAQAALINQVYRAAINQLFVDPANPGILIAELVLPPDVGGWWIRELGIEDDSGAFVAIANCAPSYKPLLAQGSGRNQVVRMHLIVSNTANVELKIDPSIVLATREYVDNAIIAHAESRNHPDATTTKKGLLRKATLAEAKGREGTAGAVMPSGLGAALTDHEQADEAHGDNQISLSQALPQAPVAATVAEALAALGSFAADGYQNVAIFDTAGVTNWSVPIELEQGLRKAHVTVVGGGGGGARNNSSGGGGGGGGGVAIGLIDLTDVDNISITVGSGGIGGANDGSDGSPGGTSSFAAYCSATGGNGAVATSGSPFGPGAGQGGDINYQGSYGTHSLMTGSNASVGGYGGGVGGGAGGTFGRPGGAPGAGGGGATNVDAAGNGAPGIVIVRW